MTQHDRTRPQGHRRVPKDPTTVRTNPLLQRTSHTRLKDNIHLGPCCTKDASCNHMPWIGHDPAQEDVMLGL